MAATKGNKWWMLRAKHGRDKLFKTSDLLWDAALEYFNHTDSRKWTKKDWVGKDAHEVERETETPYTISGLCLYLDCSRSFFAEFKKALNEKNDKESKDFLLVITRIENIIFTQKIEGAAVGAFNANIVAMELGLKQQTETTTTAINYNAELSKDEIKAISKGLDEKY
ncbi:MAG: terminase small subunit [Bacteroidota bacterium]